MRYQVLTPTFSLVESENQPERCLKIVRRDFELCYLFCSVLRKNDELNTLKVLYNVMNFDSHPEQGFAEIPLFLYVS